MSLSDDDLEDDDGASVELDEGDASLIKNEDGSLTLQMEEGDASVQRADSWFANIAEELDPAVLKRLATDFLYKIEEDKEARQKRDEQYAEGLRRTGLGNDAPGGAQFLGASKVVHPMMAQATVDFASRVIKELMPPNGPVKSKIIPKATKNLLAKADRKSRYMNWQFTSQIAEYRSELEQTLTQAPLGGAGYMEWWRDNRLKRARVEFVPIDYVTLPFEAANIYTAERVTLTLKLDQMEFLRRINSGEYLDVRLTIPVEPEPTQAEEANQKIEGKEQSGQNIDGVRELYKVYARDIDVGDAAADGETRPYILVIDQTDEGVVAVYRNWHEDDDQHKALDWLVEFGFIPWRGAYPIGLPHLIGSLSASATGTLRALMDTAHINNFPGAVKLKSGINGQNRPIEPTQIAELEGPPGVQDIRQLVMPLPFNPPSPVLFELLKFIVDAGQGVIRTSLNDTADSNANVPVGTTLARIEQGLVSYSAVFARMHAANTRSMEILHRINRDFLEDQDVVNELGDLIVYREDFEGPMDVAPVSDPQIFSEQQRIQQARDLAQRVQETAALGLPIYNPVAVEKRLLQSLKIPDYESLLNETHDASEVDPAEENVRASLGRPIRAYEDQNHDAHLSVHLAYLGDQSYGLNPLIAPGLAPAMAGHIREHLIYRYKTQMDTALKQAAGIELERDDDEMEMDDAERRSLERFEATAGVMIHNAAMNQPPAYVAKIMPTLQMVAQAAQQGQQFMQMLMPPPPEQPPDPSIAAMQAETQRKAQRDQMDMQLAQAKQQGEDAREQARLQAEQQAAQLQADFDRQRVETDNRRIAAQQQTAAESNATKLAINQEDNLTAMKIAAGEMITKERTSLSTGTGSNPNPNPR